MQLLISGLFVVRRGNERANPAELARPLPLGDGRAAFVASTAPGGADLSIIAAAHDLIRGAEGGKLREDYSLALFIIENQVRGTYEFPDLRKAKEAAAANKAAEEQSHFDRLQSLARSAEIQLAEAQRALSEQAGRLAANREAQGKSAPSDGLQVSPAGADALLPPGHPESITPAPPLTPLPQVPQALHSEVTGPAGFVPAPEVGANGGEVRQPAIPTSLPAPDPATPAGAPVPDPATSTAPPSTQPASVPDGSAPTTAAEPPAGAPSSTPAAAPSLADATKTRKPTR